ncbi:MAG: BamA/TamA family outer membrane protein [Saprospiraceae bacterium]|nr:outer membrane protein assembly factor [Saprospiraceae bacterium]MDW8228484.1 BamA/TamA family outer membrane protein [Saprospiraceae bacterium]
MRTCTILSSARWQRLLLGSLLAFFVLTPQKVFLQTTAQTSFGKSRVQYGHQFDEWMHYETTHFDTYWYGEARNVAQAALQIAEWDFISVQQLLEHQISDKIEMLVFTHLSDLKQSNIGEEELLSMKAGETKVLGNKVFVFFDGNYQHLRAQVREGTAGVILNSMIFGSSLQEIVQTAVAVNLPPWYTTGLAAYCGEEWNTDLDNRLRDYFLRKKNLTFDQMAREQPRLAGHAFWYYIGLHFGKGTISNLIYLTRINRSIDAGFLYVLGSGYRRTTDALMEYFRARYRDEEQGARKPDGKNEITFKNKRNLPVYGLKLSPDGKRLAWATNDLGKWRVWMRETADKDARPRRIFKGGQRNALQAPDFNYPLVAFSPNNQEMAVLYERRGTLYLTQIDLKTLKRQTKPLAPDYQRVYSMEYLNPMVLVFSACARGYGDLFLYNTVNRNTERLTQDFWNDLDATVAVLDGQRGILFSSNRLSDTLAPQRLDTVLPITHFDIFFFNLDQRSNQLLRLTNTPLYDERYPVSLDSQHFAHVSNASGIANRQAGYLEPYVAYYEDIIYLKDAAEVRALNTRQSGEWPFEQVLAFLSPTDTVLKNIDSTTIDSIRTFPVVKKRPVVYDQTNYDRNVEEQHSAPRAGRLAQRIWREGKMHLYVRPIQPEVRARPWLTRFREMTLRAAGLPLPERSLPADLPIGDVAERPDTSEGPVWRSYADSVRTIPPGWLFQMPERLRERGPEPPPAAETPQVALKEPEVQPALPETNRPYNRFRPTSSASVHRFMPHRIVPYRLRFRSDFFSTTVDNNLLFEGLESFAGSPQAFTTPPPGILMRANFKDLLEDYVIEMGMRLPTTFNGAEYFLWFDNKKRRLDKRIALYRRGNTHTVEQGLGGPAASVQARTTTVLGQYEVRYPLNPFFSLRAMGTLRQDKTITLSTNRRTLEQPAFAEQRMALRLSAVYDNTVPVDLNLRTGTRAKVFVEAVKRFEFNTEPAWSFRFNRGFMTVLGIDARHYQPLDRRSILALRLAGATTFGSERILYFLGGVDNWIFPSFNNTIPVPEEGAFAFRTLAANLRGFRQNIRNGNSYALLNTELRVPLFKYFSQKPVLSNFWRNFQLVGFFDAGTAWQGRSPYNPDNPINTVFFYNPPTVTVKVNYFRDPIVAGYGVGVRAPLLGMFLRVDYAWGIETRVVQKPMWHLALGTDF